MLAFMMPSVLDAAISGAPASKEFLNAVDKMKTSSDTSDKSAGYLPFPMDRSHMKIADYSEYMEKAQARGALPAKYDLRDVNGKNFVTPAKKQVYSDCWTYSALGSVESIYLKKTGTTLDLSEMHLLWFTMKTEPAFKVSFSSGAFDNTAVAALARWIGPVLESDLPSTNSSPSGVYSDYATRLHLQHAYFLALEFVKGYDASTMDVRKELIYDHGAISVGINSSTTDGATYYNKDTNAGYNHSTKFVDHAVLLCGWDDDFPKESFNKEPSRNGAWLIKNSRGTSAGDNGFFWVSYDDVALCDGVAFIAEETSNYDKNYMYDELGWCWSVGSGSETGWMANVFTSGSTSEDLKAVAFYTTGNNADYEIKVYANPTNLSIPDSGTLVATKSGAETFGGYHTVALTSPVALAPRTTFAVVVKLKTSGYNYPIPVEMPISLVASDVFISDMTDNASANSGESFISENGITWENATFTGGGRTVDVNVCIKAFTKLTSTPTPDPDPDPGNGGGGGGCHVGAGLFLALSALGVTLMRKRRD